MTHKKTLVITTGGTIESFYNPEESTPYNVPQETASVIPAALKKLGISASCDVYEACIKDSKGVHTPMLQHIAHYIAEHDQEYDGIVITHGTDTMPIHGRKLKSLLTEYEISPKPVIFTGSMTPLRDKDKNWRNESDGWTNLRTAIASAKTEEPGTYIVMDGKRHDAEALDKHVETNPDNTVSRSEFVARTLQGSGIFYGD